jgi:hypothetical protein
LNFLLKIKIKFRKNLEISLNSQKMEKIYEFLIQNNKLEELKLLIHKFKPQISGLQLLAIPTSSTEVLDYLLSLEQPSEDVLAHAIIFKKDVKKILDLGTKSREIHLGYAIRTRDPEIFGLLLERTALSEPTTIAESVFSEGGDEIVTVFLNDKRVDFSDPNLIRIAFETDNSVLGLKILQESTLVKFDDSYILRAIAEKNDKKLEILLKSEISKETKDLALSICGLCCDSKLIRSMVSGIPIKEPPVKEIEVETIMSSGEAASGSVVSEKLVDEVVKEEAGVAESKKSLE